MSMGVFQLKAQAVRVGRNGAFLAGDAPLAGPRLSGGGVGAPQYGPGFARIHSGTT